MKERPDGPLHIKYRPKNFDEVIGNSSTIKMLKSVLGRDTGIPHAMLFAGPSGCSKTTLCRIIKEEMGCANIDFVEYNAGNTRGIDTIREIRSLATLQPKGGKVKIYLLDEVHALTKDSMRALLKLLEDPPKRTYFLLATTDPQDLIKPLFNRCTKFYVEQLKSSEIKKLLLWVLEEEGDETISNKVISEIVRVSDGCPRDALVTLDSIIDLDNEDEMIDAIKDSTVDQSSVKELCKALIANTGGERKWKDIQEVLRNLKSDPERTRHAILGYFKSAILNEKTTLERAGHFGSIAECFEQPLYNTGVSGLTLCCLRAVLED